MFNEHFGIFVDINLIYDNSSVVVIDVEDVTTYWNHHGWFNANYVNAIIFKYSNLQNSHVYIGAHIKFKAITRSVFHTVHGKSEIPRANFVGVYPVQNVCSIKFHIHCAGFRSRLYRSVSPWRTWHYTQPARENLPLMKHLWCREKKKKKPRFYHHKRSTPPISITAKNVNRAWAVR